MRLHSIWLVINEDGFSIVLATHAVDPDGDVLTYTFSWGDGSAEVSNNSGVATHAYAEIYQAYAIRVVVSDGRGAATTTELVVDFPEPGANRAPNLTSYRRLVAMGLKSPSRRAQRTQTATS